MPKAIVNLLKFYNFENTRFVKAPIGHKINSQSAITFNSLLYKGIFLYSKIDQNLKTKNIKQFKKAIKIYIGENLPIDRMVQQSDYG